MIELLAMGDYGFYVWTSVGLVCAVLMAQAWRAHRALTRAKQALAWSQDVES